MIIKQLYNSSGKKVGTIEIYEDKIILNSKSKLRFTIRDLDIVALANNPHYDENILRTLYNNDNYLLTIPEIAAIFGVLYHRANQWLKALYTTIDKRGRRNSSYQNTFSDTRRSNISKGLSQYFQNGGKSSYYERTPEIKEKIRLGVQKAIREGRLNESENALKGWRNNKFQNSDFKRGIAGSFYSFKNSKRILFRSLLELYYMLILENKEDIKSYSYETVHIRCDNGSTYTPDLFVDNTLIELKCYEWIYRVGVKQSKIKEDFEYKVSQGKKYCRDNNLRYKVIFDKDLQYKSDVFINQIKTSNIVEKYQIKFNDPKRIWSDK